MVSCDLIWPFGCLSMLRRRCR